MTTSVWKCIQDSAFQRFSCKQPLAPKNSQGLEDIKNFLKQLKDFLYTFIWIICFSITALFDSNYFCIYMNVLILLLYRPFLKIQLLLWTSVILSLVSADVSCS